MKSPYRIAKEIGVSPQAVYKKLTDEVAQQLGNHMQKTKKGKYLLDSHAEDVLKGLFNLVVQPDIEPVVQLDIQPLLNQLSSENEFLRQQIEKFEKEL